MGHRDVPPTGRLRGFDAGEDRAGLREQGAAELGDDVELVEGRDDHVEDLTVGREGRGHLVAGEVDRQAAADVDAGDLASTRPRVDLAGEVDGRGDPRCRLVEGDALRPRMDVDLGQPRAGEVGLDEGVAGARVGDPDAELRRLRRRAHRADRADPGLRVDPHPDHRGGAIVDELVESGELLPAVSIDGDAEGERAAQLAHRLRG